MKNQEFINTCQSPVRCVTSPRSPSRREVGGGGRADGRGAGQPAASPASARVPGEHPWASGTGLGLRGQQGREGAGPPPCRTRTPSRPPVCPDGPACRRLGSETRPWTSGRGEAGRFRGLRGGPALLCSGPQARALCSLGRHVTAEMRWLPPPHPGPVRIAPRPPCLPTALCSASRPPGPALHRRPRPRGPCVPGTTEPRVRTGPWCAQCSGAARASSPSQRELRDLFRVTGRWQSPSPRWPQPAADRAPPPGHRRAPGPPSWSWTSATLGERVRRLRLRKPGALQGRQVKGLGSLPRGQSVQ